MKTENWFGCYRHGWGKELIPMAYQHPAKCAYGLAERIYAFLFERGLLVEGMTVIDPFAGIGGFAYHALKHGLHFRGVELEEKFVRLGEANIALWNARYAGRFRTWGTAKIYQGDSRRLAQVLAEADCSVTSPPYEASIQGSGAEAARKRIEEGRYHGLRPDVWTSKGNIAGSTYGDGYGQTPGNLGNLAAREGDLDAALTSPPFLQTSGGTNVTSESGPLADGKLIARHAAGNAAAEAFGSDPAQLGNLREGDISDVIAALPEGPVEAAQSEEPDTFWAASRMILAQTYALLRPHVEGRPGGIAVFVLKRYVRDGQIIEFSDNWRRLAESVGFQTLYWIRAWLTTDDGTQLAMDGNHKRYHKKRVGFFRRLHEKKRPDLAIDWEDVIVMCRPLPGGDGGAHV